ncbi:hypothetical protein D9758_007370 [Tetrapyrgos nigripes]|uniref:Uncharacterized protein n=1 Tax=Tetrapyrgos nigripes TaxID=182062 RepID=A0A8H5GB01_9AGAR|nr:hypothetical protein D9758_007370 [Tetrapyrgos nigripes]
MVATQRTSVELAYVWGITLSSFLYGIYLILFAAAMYILLLPLSPTFGLRERVNKVLITVTVLMCLTCTTHFVVQFIRLHKGYSERMNSHETLHHVGDGVDGPVPYLEDLTQPLAIVTGVCFTIAAVLTDGLTIYRLYIMWNRKFTICILPVITLTGMLVCGFAMCAVTSEMSPSSPLFGTPAAEWLTSTFVIGLATNFIALSSVTVRFRKNARDRKKIGLGVTGTTKMMMLVLVESSALYSGTKFINLMLLVSETSIAFVFFCIVIPIIGIASHILIIRLGWIKYFKHGRSITTSFGVTSGAPTSGISVTRNLPMLSSPPPALALTERRKGGAIKLHRIRLEKRSVDTIIIDHEESSSSKTRAHSDREEGPSSSRTLVSPVTATFPTPSYTIGLPIIPGGVKLDDT